MTAVPGNKGKVKESEKGLKYWPFLYYRQIIRLDELSQLNFCSSDSSSNKFSTIKTGNRRIIRLNTEFVEIDKYPVEENYDA